MKTYDEFGRTRPLDVLGRCRRCGRWLKNDEAVREIHPTRGGPGLGFEHRHCPPALAVVR